MAANPPPRWLLLILPAIIACFTFVAFIPSLHGQFLDWDDDTNFVHNPAFRGLGWDQISWMFSRFYYGHYQPISWLTLGWDFVWGRAALAADPVLGPGMNPRAFHLTNLLIHSMNAVLMYLLALRLITLARFGDGRRRTTRSCLTAAAAALLFSVHPLRVENVAWITERRDLVNACFLLLTVLAYLRAAQSTGRTRWTWLGASFVLYIMCLMSKVSGVPLVAALFALDWYPLNRLRGTSGQSAVSASVEKLPFIAAAALFSIIAVVGQSADHWLYPLDRHPMDARVAQSFYGLVFYLRKTIAPCHLLPLYELHSPLNLGQAWFVTSFVLVSLALVALGALLVRRKGKAIVVASICYVAFLGPVLGLFQNGPQLVADRYSYLPMIGVTIVLAGGLAWSLAKRGVPGIVRWSAAAAALLVIATLAMLTWQQCKIWQTTESLWGYTLKHDPDSAVANNGYGVMLSQSRKLPDQAVPYFQKAVAMEPAVKFYRGNLRNALRDAGRMPELVAAWLDEYNYVRRNSGHPPFDANWHSSAAIEASKSNNLSLALEHDLVSLAINPSDYQTEHNCAVVLERLNRLDEAQVHYRKAIELSPANIHSRLNLAELLMRQNRPKDAALLLDEILRIDNSNAEARALLSRIQQGQ